MDRHWRWPFFILLVGLIPLSANASKASYHVANPLGWMHDLPVGETPGWNGSFWMNFEVNHANIWNNEFSLTNRTTMKTLTYKADFEQTSLVTDVGFAVGERLAFEVSAPFATRGSGVLDHFIDQVHLFAGADRFLRNLNDQFSKELKIETNGTNQFGHQSWTAIGNLKLKSKLWLLKWTGSKNGSCDCGFSVSGQVKLPLATAKSGMSSGTTDYSLLFHLGAPLGANSGIWATAAYTALGKNEVLKDWPQRRYAQMYEISMDLGGETWGFLLQARTESPLMNKSSLNYNYVTSDPEDQVTYRVASGWNGLVYWRGTQSAGFRWRSQLGRQINFLLVEDWNTGSQDSLGNGVYVTNAPDISFVTQFYLNF